MNTAIFVAFALVASTSAYDLVQDEEGQRYFLVPLHRQRRQVSSVDIAKANKGVRITGSHEGNLFNQGGHRVDGSAFASKTFKPSGPLTVGGGVQYQHTPSGSNVNVGAQHTQRYGTDVGVSGTGNIWRNGNSRLDAVGNYNRHFGGAGGTGKPNYYGGIQFNHKF